MTEDCLCAEVFSENRLITLAEEETKADSDVEAQLAVFCAVRPEFSSEPKELILEVGKHKPTFLSSLY